MLNLTVAGMLLAALVPQRADFQTDTTFAVPAVPFDSTSLNCVLAALLTLKLTALEVVELPAASDALAVSECEALLSVFESSAMEYGLLVSLPLSTPST